MARLKTRSYGTLLTLLAALLLTSMGVPGLRSGVQAQTRVNDETLKDRIEYRIETSPAVRKYDIRVNVDHAAATLSGRVATTTQKAEAGRLAKVEGVAHVDNQITVDRDADRTVMDHAKNGMRKTGEAVTDTWITTKVKWFFMGDDLLKGSHIDVDTRDRVVTLNGTVRTAAGRRQAVRLAQETDGVTRVVDNLKVQ